MSNAKTRRRPATALTGAAGRIARAKAAAKAGEVAPAAQAPSQSAKAPKRPQARPSARTAPAAIPAPAKPAAPASATPRLAGKALGARAQAQANAEAGKLPSPPDFSAPTHKSYRARLAALIAMAEVGDVAGLEAVAMVPPRSSSPKALHRYRDLALVALKARAQG